MKVFLFQESSEFLAGTTGSLVKALQHPASAVHVQPNYQPGRGRIAVEVPEGEADEAAMRAWLTDAGVKFEEQLGGAATPPAATTTAKPQEVPAKQ